MPVIDVIPLELRQPWSRAELKARPQEGQGQGHAGLRGHSRHLTAGLPISAYGGGVQEWLREERSGESQERSDIFDEPRVCKTEEEGKVLQREGAVWARARGRPLQATWGPG